MRKFFRLLAFCSVFALVFVLVADAPIARGAPAPAKTTIESSAVCYAQLCPAVVQQDIKDPYIGVVVAPTRRQVVEGIGEFIVSADTGKVLLAVLYLQPVTDEIIVASCGQPISSSAEIIGIARACDAQEVVTRAIESVSIVARSARISGEIKPAVFTEMTRAIETQRRPLVQRI